MTAVDHDATGNTPDDLGQLPGGGAAIVNIVRLAYHFQPKLLWVSLGLTVVGALPDALIALWLGLLAKALDDGADPDRTLLIVSGAGLAFSAVGGWVLRAGGDRLNLRFRQRLAVSLETHVARLQAPQQKVCESRSTPKAVLRARCNCVSSLGAEACAQQGLIAGRSHLLVWQTALQ